MLRPEKGHEFMLNLLFRLKKEGRKFRWLVVGSRSVENERRLRAIVDDLDMHDNVLISGGIFPVSSIYKIANLIVMPSENESFGMVAAEASVFSIPVFANHVGGLPDVIQHNRTGTLLPAGDMQVWRSALNDFLNDQNTSAKWHIRQNMMWQTVLILTKQYRLFEVLLVVNK